MELFLTHSLVFNYYCGPSFAWNLLFAYLPSNSDLENLFSRLSRGLKSEIVKLKGLRTPDGQCLSLVTH